MIISRRGFLTSLVGGGLTFSGGASSLAWAGDAAMPIAAAQSNDEISGYPLTLASGVPQPAWSALPGQTVHFALSAGKHMNRPLRLTAADGKLVHDFGMVDIRPQHYMSDSPWLDGAGYAPTVSWTIPLHQASGVYFLNGLPDLFVIVRKPLSGARAASASSALTTAILVPTNTINAYTATEGRSVYAHPKRVPEVSFLRPFNASARQSWTGTLAWLNADPLFGAPRHLADSDLDDARVLNGVQLLIVIGHSEYWTRKARQVFDAFVAGGGHVIMASGNAMWWQVRYGDAGRRMICYKDYDPQFGKDPETNPLLVTRNWVDSELKYPITDSIGGDFIHGGYGSRRPGLNVKGRGLRVIDVRHPLFAGQAIGACQDLDFGGVDEYDGAPIKGLDARGLPVAAAGLDGSRLEIVAYEWTKRGGTTLATAHLYQRQADGGIVFHLGAPEATNANTSGSQVMRHAAHQFARRLLHKQSPFSSVAPAAVAHVLHTPWAHPLPVIAGRCAPPRGVGA